MKTSLTNTKTFDSAENRYKIALYFDVKEGNAKNMRNDLEQFIAGKFYQIHSATITEFYPLLLEFRSPKLLRAGIGLRMSSQRENFFLQQYLLKPVQKIIEKKSKKRCLEEEIVEIGNFAADCPKLGIMLFSILALTLYNLGFKWVVFTATKTVAGMLKYLNCHAISIGNARVDMLQNNKESWGAYYGKKPFVMACDVKEFIKNTQTNSSMVKTVSEHASIISYVSNQLDTIFKVV